MKCNKKPWNKLQARWKFEFLHRSLLSQERKGKMAPSALGRSKIRALNIDSPISHAYRKRGAERIRVPRLATCIFLSLHRLTMRERCLAKVGPLQGIQTLGVRWVFVCSSHGAKGMIEKLHNKALRHLFSSLNERASGWSAPQKAAQPNCERPNAQIIPKGVEHRDAKKKGISPQSFWFHNKSEWESNHLNLDGLVQIKLCSILIVLFLLHFHYCAFSENYNCDNDQSNF